MDKYVLILCLNHVVTLRPQARHVTVHVDSALVLDPLQHRVDDDEGTGSSNSSTKYFFDEKKYRYTLTKMHNRFRSYIKVIRTIFKAYFGHPFIKISIIIKLFNRTIPKKLT